MRAALLLLAALLLTACVSRPPQQSLPLQPYAQRRLALQSIERYSVEARVAVAVGSEGFNVNLIWNQTGPRSELDLRAPLPKDFEKMLKALRKLSKPVATQIKRGLRSPLNPK